MTSAVRICAKCGATIFADAPRGFCSVCLFRTALGALVDGNDETPNDARIQMEFGDYELLEELGRGGQGVVYRARQKSLNRTVALKVIGLGQWSSTPHLKRFRRDAEAAASLEHPQIVPIYEIGERDGSCYFSMKFVEGGQLDEVVKREPMSARRAAELLVKIARTVHFAHEHGILHRDIKPGNILLDRHGEPHLTDFGLARLIEQESTVTNSLDVLGTPSYMSPEQAAGHAKDLTAATDVYSLGAVLYQMLTGEPPFAGGTTYETIRMVLESEPRNPRVRNPKVDVDLATICLKCLEKDPPRRYATALALAEDLERWLRHEPIRARRTGVFTRGKKWLQRNPSTAFAEVSLAALALAVGVIIWKSDLFRSLPTAGIAVLPFENLSEDRANSYFADGIQDEILTRLSKIADLKVIARSSTQYYKSAPANLPEIARQLGVANILEGSVQKVADQAHINVQLIRAATGEHLWAESYDRKLENIFGIEGEVATRVSAALKARLSGAEKQALAQIPTNNPQAYDAYLHGLAYALRPHSGYIASDTLGAISHFAKAVELDPNFALAWAWLARVSALGYFNFMGDDPPALRETAQHAVVKASQLQPNLDDTSLAEGYFHYYCELNYDAAIASFEKARQLAPSASEALHALALVSRRKNEWQRSLEYFRQATQLDPRNIALLSDYADALGELRQYSAALKIYDQILEISPNDADALAMKANVYQSEANLSEAAMLLARIPFDPGADLYPTQIQQKIYERRFSDAIAMINAARARRDRPVTDSLNVFYDTTLADLQQFSGDIAGARLTWQHLKSEIESLPRSKMKSSGTISVFQAGLAVAYAGLGEQPKALAIVQEALADQKVNDQLYTASLAGLRARIAAHAGDRDAAVEQLAIVAQNPGDSGVDYGDLKLNPLWDPLRGDPRFEKIVASLAPK